MFTGLIEEIGEIVSINKNAKSAQLRISASKILQDSRIGDSIAVNGVCLTITTIGDSYFTADIMSETMAVTNLSKLSISSKVNLERALRVGDRLGGHIVSGHIDTQGEITSFKNDENAIWVTITCDTKFLKYLIHRGSICIDGISLTVASLEKSNFQVSIIPHTSIETTLIHKKIGSKVNLEFDILSKYIGRLLDDNKTGITMEFLQTHGF